MYANCGIFIYALQLGIIDKTNNMMNFQVQLSFAYFKSYIVSDSIQDKLFYLINE